MLAQLLGGSMWVPEEGNHNATFTHPGFLTLILSSPSPSLRIQSKSCGIQVPSFFFLQSVIPLLLYSLNSCQFVCMLKNATAKIKVKSRDVIQLPCCNTLCGAADRDESRAGHLQLRASSCHYGACSTALVHFVSQRRMFDFLTRTCFLKY